MWSFINPTMRVAATVAPRRRGSCADGDATSNGADAAVVMAPTSMVN